MQERPLPQRYLFILDLVPVAMILVTIMAMILATKIKATMRSAY